MTVTKAIFGLITLIVTLLPSSESEPVVFRKNNKIGYVDARCSIVIPLSFYYGFDFHEGLAAVQKEPNGKWGFIDLTGDYVIPPKYDGAGDFSEGLAAVENEQQTFSSYLDTSWGFIDKNDTLVINYSFSDVYDISDGVVAGELANYWHYLDVRTKKRIGDGGFRFATTFENGVAIVSKERTDLMGCIDKNGTVVAPYRHKWIFAASEGMMRMEHDGKYGYFDDKCRPLISPRFTYAGNFHDGRAMVVIKGGTGYIDKEANVVISPVYEDAGDFGEGLAAVKRRGKWGYIDRQGNVVIPFRFDEAERFDHGVARIKLKDQWGLIDRRGNHLLSPRYHFETYPRGNHLIYTKDGEIFCVDSNMTIRKL